MKLRFHVLAVMLLSLLLSACVSYDQPVIYKKNYVQGHHDLLRFDGWYLQPAGQEGRVKPIFFYANGTLWFGEAPVSTAADLSAAPHSWGNYKISGDTIYAERFYKQQTSDNYNRIIMTGIVQRDNIRWVLREAHRENPETINYDSPFEAHAGKPDSTQNWTRTYPPFNK